jgi:opine dehydrogenase
MVESMAKSATSSPELSTPPSVAVLGAGHQGHTFAGYLGLNGVEVSIVNRSQSKVASLREKGGIEVTGEFSGFVEPDRVTTDVAAGIAGRDVVLIAVPAYGHEHYIRELAGVVGDDQLVFFPTDNYGSVRLRRRFAETGSTTPPVAGAAISPFPGLADGPGVVDTHGAKDSVPLAAVPGGDTEEVLSIINALFEPAAPFEPATNIFEVNLQNLNPYMHSAINVFNLAQIDAGADWLYYGEGCTPAVERVVAGFDEERLAVGEALGLELQPLRDLVGTMYESSVSGDTIVEMLGESPVHRSLPGPTDLSHEYLTEDVPHGLVPLASICSELGIPCPTLDSVIDLLSIGTDSRFRESGTTVEELGFKGMDSATMLEAVSDVQ